MTGITQLSPRAAKIINKTQRKNSNPSCLNLFEKQRTTLNQVKPSEVSVSAYVRTLIDIVAEDSDLAELAHARSLIAPRSNKRQKLSTSEEAV